MVQRINPPEMPFSDDPTVKDAFAHSCAGLNVINGNVHMTFATVIADHSGGQAASKRVVSARIVMPVAGATDLRDLLTQMLDALAAQGTDILRPAASAVVTPLRRPN